MGSRVNINRPAKVSGGARGWKGAEENRSLLHYHIKEVSRHQSGTTVRLHDNVGPRPFPSCCSIILSMLPRGPLATSCWAGARGLGNCLRADS